MKRAVPIVKHAGPEKPVPVSEVKAKLSEIIDRARFENKAVVIAKHQKSIAVILPHEKYLRMQQLADQLKSDQLRAELKRGTRPLREILAKLDLGL